MNNVEINLHVHVIHVILMNPKLTRGHTFPPGTVGTIQNVPPARMPQQSHAICLAFVNPNDDGDRVRMQTRFDITPTERAPARFHSYRHMWLRL